MRDIDLSVFVRMADKISAPLKDVENTVAKASERMTKRLNLSLKLGAGGAVATTFAYASKRMVEGFTDSIREVERAKGELATLGVQDLAAVVDKGREMQTQLAGVTADAFVRAAYDIKSGISTLTDQGVADMTASAMTVAKATRGQAEQMTSLFATSYGIFKKQMADITDAEFGEQFGAALSASVQQFKTDGSAMQQAIESAGAGAVNLGMQMTEQLTLLGMMQQQMQSGEAGTALRAFATNAAKAHEAFADMKVSSKYPVRVRILDENGQLRAMPDILSDLKARYGETLDAFEAAEIKKAFGTDEAMKMINALYGQEAAVRANAAALNDAAEQGAEFTEKMAKAADSNWDSAMLLMAQKMDVLRQKIGDRLLPVVTKLLPVIDAFIDKAFTWIDANPALITGIGAVVVGLGAVAAVIGPVLLGASALVSAWATLSFGAVKLVAGLLGVGKVLGKTRAVLASATRGVLWLAKGALPLVARGLMMIGRALMANPLGALLTIAQGAFLIYKYWEPITDFFANLWDRVKERIFTAWEGIKARFQEYSPAALILGVWSGVASFFSGLWESVKTGVAIGWESIKTAFLMYTPAGLIIANWDSMPEWFSGLWERVKTSFAAKWAEIKAEVATWPAKMKEYGGDLIQKLIDGIRAKFSALSKAVSDALSRLNPFSKVPVHVDISAEAKASAQNPGKSGLSAGKQQAVAAKQAARLKAAGVPGYAKGGTFNPGWIMVGEEGPELRYESKGGFIAHNRALQGMENMAARARDMLGRSDMGGAVNAATGMEQMAIPAMSEIAPLSAPASGAQINYAPVTNMPPLSLERGVDLAEAQELFAAMLDERDERARADMRGLLHDV